MLEVNKGRLTIQSKSLEVLGNVVSGEDGLVGVAHGADAGVTDSRIEADDNDYHSFN